jgi:hypothetical protein
VFTVLAFGLSSTGYILTKVVRLMVAHLRKDGIKVTVYHNVFTMRAFQK